MKVGMVGLGKMGANMAARLGEAGHEVVGFDAYLSSAEAERRLRLGGDAAERSSDAVSPAHGASGAGPLGPSGSDASQVGSLGELASALESPRVVWLMVPSGDPTESTVDELTKLLSRDDVVVDGGNSNWRDSVRRGQALADHGIGFVDCGTSGGVWGRENGYSLMVGGDAAHVALVEPLFLALKPTEGGYAHVGALGTGHFTKMVHNGIEYGLMQSYAEGYELLARSGLGIDVTAALEAWQHGSVVRSWLLDLLVRALQESPGLEGIAGVAKDSGEGRWTVLEAIERGVATPAMSAALHARFVSQVDDSVAMKAVAALRDQFGGHGVVTEPGGQP